jgi:hypothetical protein
MTFRSGGGTTETDRAVQLRAAVKSKVGEVEKTLNRHVPCWRQGLWHAVFVRRDERDSVHVEVTSALLNPPVGFEPVQPRGSTGSFNASQRGEHGFGDEDHSGATVPATSGKSSGGEKFNHERPARACW